MASRRRAFTLVELLVVIGIISVLIALLFPALRRARKQAMVLATPIVYVGKDQKLHLTDPSGQMSVSLMSKSGNACPVCHVPPVWSPSGDAILFRTTGTTSPGPATALLNPMSEKPSTVRAQGELVGWLDSTRYVEGEQGGTLYVKDAATGRLERTVRPANPVFFLAPAPPSCPAPIIASVRLGNSDAICFLKKDFNPGKVVFIRTGPGGGPRTNIQSPQVDSTGEFVAWTILEGGAVTAFKAVNEPATRAPTIIGPMMGSGPGPGPRFQRVYFCDWTEQGELLCNTTLDGVNYQLAIFDRQGQLVRTLATEMAPARGIIASWRKYGHQ